jgi:hypothetical protein
MFCGFSDLERTVGEIHRFSREELETYIWQMPERLADAIRAVSARTEPTTYGSRERNAELVQVVKEAWLDLMEQLPGDFFGDRSASQVFEDAIAPRLEIYRQLIMPRGEGHQGTIWPQIVSSALFDDAKAFVAIAAESLMGLGVDAERWDVWKAKWFITDLGVHSERN